MRALREATLQDVEGMAALRAVEWGSLPYWRERIHGYMAGMHHPQQALAPRTVVVAIEQDLLTGFAAGHLTRRHGCDGELQWINVARDRRGAGLADDLLRWMATWFSTQRARLVCVDVDAGNPVARAFYLRHGAQPLNDHWLVWEDIARAGKDAQ